MAGYLIALLLCVLPADVDWFALPSTPSSNQVIERYAGVYEWTGRYYLWDDGQGGTRYWHDWTRWNKLLPASTRPQQQRTRPKSNYSLWR
jgi:hypothetical protein